MALWICIIFGILFLVAMISFSHHLLKLNDKERLKAIDSRLHKVDLDHLGQLYTPNCHFCKGTGEVEERHGVMVHHTEKVECQCRRMENWLLSLIDKWIEEGDVHHATELLLILREKI